MSTIQSATTPSIAPINAASTTASSPPTGRRSLFRPGRILALAAVVGLVAVGSVPVMSWIEYRRNHSITDDVFVEAHIVNVAPQVVSGRLLRYLVDENDQVVQGQVVAELDPIPYRDKVNIAQAQLESAQAELARQRADLDLVRKEVPIQIEIARRTFAAAVSDRAKAEESLKFTNDDVEKGIDEARAGVKAATSLAHARRTGVHTLHPTRATGGEPATAAAAGDTVSRLGFCAGGSRRSPASESSGLANPD